MKELSTELPSADSDIAIIGMSCRFPGANTIDTFWQNVRDGVESISFFSDEELIASGVEPVLLNNANYVKASAVLSDIELFDASFFGFSAKEATMMDPQHRLFLMCAVEALENAGYYTEHDETLIGVYAGVGRNSYLFNNLRDLLESGDVFQVLIGNDKDFLSTRVSYKLNLTGPSVNVQTACSTSLVAVHLARQSLLIGDCDIALAGGVTINLPQQRGYLYQEGMILSPDGHCRAFDSKAQGTVGGNGVGIVVLKRLEEAITDGDCIHAIIKGSAINNDGSSKVGYTAPSVNGQASVISEAQAIAGIEANTITYIEAHGTGTTLGDPIEIEALTQAFRATTQNKGFCAIGSVKTNLGHTDTASGVVGLIKTVLALKHRLLPPSLHFEQPNPKTDFANSPFYVNTTLSEWKTNGIPRRAGVSSFGIGGTNAHVILEEASTCEQSEKSRPWQLLVISAKTQLALETATANLAKHLEQHPSVNLADVAYTLSQGRRRFSHRRMLVCQTLENTITALQTLDPKSVFTHVQEREQRPVIFMFSGQGAQYVSMGLALYQTEPTFRDHIDHCSEYLKPHIGLDLRQVLYPSEERVQEAALQLQQTAITQIALFVIEYALAQLWKEWGVYPQAMIGHSIGEYVAACLAGVFSLEEALSLVTNRGQLMQSVPPGAMLAVSLSAPKIQPFLAKGLSLASINGPDRCVVSGITEIVEALQNQLTEQGVECRRLQTSHAFHSEMMEPILAAFTEQVKQVRLNSPKIPYVSNVTGTWITAQEATDPNYWASHLRQTVHFAEGLQQVLEDSAQILLEVGPGRTLSTLAQRHPDKVTEQMVLTSLRHPQDHQSDVAFLLNTVGKLWLVGGRVDWSGFYAHERRYRLSLPTYPFDYQRYWMDPPTSNNRGSQLSGHKKPEIADWFYRPVWKPSVRPVSPPPGNRASWLVFLDECGLGTQWVKKLEQADQQVITVKFGTAFTRESDHNYILNPQQRDDYETLLKTLRTLNHSPQTIVHLGCVTKEVVNALDKAQALGFYSVLFLAQALGKQNVTDEIELAVVSNHLQAVTGEDLLCPEKATVLGPIKVIGQEYPNLHCRSIDVVIPQTEVGNDPNFIEQLHAELTTPSSDPVIAYRGQHRWVQTFESIQLNKPLDETTRLRKGGVYLITGGLGNMGLVLAEYLANAVQARLILTGRSVLPARNEWDDWLNSHEAQESVSRKIRQVQKLEAQGAEVWVANADVANLQQMQQVIMTAEERFGQLNGVIHAAGILGDKSFQMIEGISQIDCEQQFQPKVYGTLVLENSLQDRKLDFCLLLSSLSSILGGLGFVAYSAANLFMDAFAHQHNQNHPVQWLSVNWDGWRFGSDTKPKTSFGATVAELTITPEEGTNAFQHILSGRPQVNQLVVSTGELQARIDQWIKLEPLRDQKSSQKAVSASHPRPSTLMNPYVAPRSDTEQTIADIWQNCLGIKPVGCHDDFFELGGDSLLAIQIIAKLRETFQTEISAHSLLNVPTIAALAELIEKTTADVGLVHQPTPPALSSVLVEIQSGNRLAPPLFLIHPVGGHVYFYRDLAHHLGTDRPVYGLQAQGLDGKTKPLTQIEDMATQYIEALRVLQPNGPYFLGGASFGGTVAFEMAQQLHKQGQKVALLAMIDTPSPGQMPTKLTDDAEILAYLLDVGEHISVSIEKLRRLEHDEQLLYCLEQMRIANRILPELEFNQFRNMLNIFKINSQAMWNYIPRVYQGKILFFRAKERDTVNSPHPEYGWIELAVGGIEIYVVPGNHITMNYSPHVEVLADKLRTYLV